MSCQNCNSERVLDFSGKVSDLFGWNMYVGDDHFEGLGDMPEEYEIVEGDYVRFKVCLDCGQTQGQWPKEKSEAEQTE